MGDVVTFLVFIHVFAVAVLVLCVDVAAYCAEEQRKVDDQPDEKAWWE